MKMNGLREEIDKAIEEYRMSISSDIIIKIFEKQIGSMKKRKVNVDVIDTTLPETNVFEVLVKIGNTQYLISNWTKTGKTQALRLKHIYKNIEDFYKCNDKFL